MIKNTNKPCLWCGKMVLTTLVDEFPRHELCTSEMNDKGLVPSINGTIGELGSYKMCLYHKEQHLRVKLNSGDVGRKVWAPYEHQGLFKAKPRLIL